MPITECTSPELQENEPIKAVFRTCSHDRPDPPSRLRAGRLARRVEKSRLNCAPPPNSIRFYRRRAGMSLQEVGR